MIVVLSYWLDEKGMVLYVAYRATRESKDRSTLPHSLRALGCRQLHRSFWEVNEENVNRVLKVLEKNQPILLRRIREIRKPRLAKDGVLDIGSLVIVMYATPKEFKREKIKNILKRAPCIRICRSVYAFSHKHSLFDREHRLVNAVRFSEFIKEIHEDVKVIPRVVLQDTTSVERLIQETREHLEREISDIIMSSQELYSQVFVGDNAQLIRDSHLMNQRRFMRVKRMAAFYERWLQIDFSRNLMRSYRAIRKVSSVLERGPSVKITASSATYR